MPLLFGMRCREFELFLIGLPIVIPLSFLDQVFECLRGMQQAVVSTGIDGAGRLAIDLQRPLLGKLRLFAFFANVLHHQEQYSAQECKGRENECDQGPPYLEHGKDDRPDGEQNPQCK